MPTYGRRPSDVVTDARGNALKGVVVHLYLTENDAKAQTNRIGVAETDYAGRWTFEHPNTEVWARVPDGSIWNLAVAGDVTVEGVTAHSALTGLQFDDHPQYHTDERGDARYYLKAAIDALLGQKAALNHGHTTSQITDFQAATQALLPQPIRQNSDGSWPARTTSTSNRSLRVTWVGTLPGPTIGSGAAQAVAGLDVMDVTTEIPA